MSFLNTIVDLGKRAVSFVAGNSTAATLLKTVASGYALRKITNSIAKDNAKPTIERAERSPVANRQLINASQDNKIPVVYGRAQLAGVITDVQMSNSNKRMSIVYTLSEKTGVKISDSQDSVFTFLDVYRNDQKIVFRSSGSDSGIEAIFSVDRDGNQDTSILGLIKVYCYRGGSSQPTVPQGFTNNTLPTAGTIMPGWGANHAMNDLVFAVVQIDYDIAKGLTSIGSFRFDIANSMTLPGDCIFDYMTNTRYGAGIPAEDIYRE